jgi:type IV secretory pathway VirB4 component
MNEDFETTLSIEELASTNAKNKKESVVEDETDYLADIDIPEIDINTDDDDLDQISVSENEFTCMKCFLVKNSSQQSKTDPQYCKECC